MIPWNVVQAIRQERFACPECGNTGDEQKWTVDFETRTLNCEACGLRRIEWELNEDSNADR